MLREDPLDVREVMRSFKIKIQQKIRGRNRQGLCKTEIFTRRLEIFKKMRYNRNDYRRSDRYCFSTIVEWGDPDLKKVDIMGVQFDAVTLTQAVDQALDQIRAGKKGYVVTPNPEIVYAAMDDPSFCEIVNRASLVLADGIGVVYAAKILGRPLQGRVPGIDFASLLMHRMSQNKLRLFLLGAKPGVAQKAAENLQKKYPGLLITGTKDGYFKEDREAVEAVNAAGGADVLFVCLGAPKQEKFMSSHLDALNVTLCCGLGGSLDVFAGTVQRAPDLFVKLGLEWFYRLCKEPRRIGRMMKLPKFMLRVLGYKLSGKGGKA